MHEKLLYTYSSDQRVGNAVINKSPAVINKSPAALKLIRKNKQSEMATRYSKYKNSNSFNLAHFPTPKLSVTLNRV